MWQLYVEFLNQWRKTISEENLVSTTLGRALLEGPHSLFALEIIPVQTVATNIHSLSKEELSF
jgi:hypothetical protein